MPAPSTCARSSPNNTPTDMLIKILLVIAVAIQIVASVYALRLVRATI